MEDKVVKVADSLTTVKPGKALLVESVDEKFVGNVEEFVDEHEDVLKKLADC